MSAKKTFLSKLPFVVFLTAIAAVLATGQRALAQVEGNVIDWSTHHLVFSDPGAEADAQKKGTHAQWLRVVKNPRYRMQVKRRSVRQTYASTLTASEPETSGATLEATAKFAAAAKGTKSNRDWALNLGSGTLAANQYPSIYTASYTDTEPGSSGGAPPTTPPTFSCLTDIAVFGLNVAGSATQANLVGVDNLYSGGGGICGTTPNVKFAYNVSTIGGAITTSPTMTLDGTQLAFVESAGSVSVLHVLRWYQDPTTDQNGTVAAPVTPTNYTAAEAGSYPGCTAPCMVTIPFGSAATTISSPFYDYAGTDNLYLGNDAGTLFAFTGIFMGTPTLGVGAWTSSGVTLGAGTEKLTAPVLDYASNNIFVGGSDGVLYAVNATSGAGVASLAVGSGGAGGGIAATPVVDSSSATVIALTGSNASVTGPPALTANTHAVAVQADTMAPFGSEQVAIIGEPSATGLAGGSFDNNYYNWSGSGSDPNPGHFFAIGTFSTSTAPYLYKIPYSGITSVSVNNHGGGYTTAPTVSFSGTGSGATATASGGVDAVTLTGNGTGYTSIPSVAIAGSTGTGTATFSAPPPLTNPTIVVGGVTYTFHSAQSYCSTTPCIINSTSWTAAQLASNLEAAINDNVSECGHTDGTTCFYNITSPNADASATVSNAVTTITNLLSTAITFTTTGSDNITLSPNTGTITAGTGGSGAAASAVVGVLSVALTNGGSGYTAVPTVTFTGSGPGGGSDTAALGINTVTFTNHGTYTSSTGFPLVTFSGGNGSGTAREELVSLVGTGGSFTSAPTITYSPTGGATATVTLGVTGLNITSGGTGYTSVPTISFSAGTTTAAATALMGVGATSIGLGGSYIGGLPTPTFAAAPAGGTTAIGTVTEGVLSLSFGTSATYTTMPTVTFTASPAGGSFTATASPTGTVLTATASGGSYATLPTVTFAAPTSGTQATGTVTGGVSAVAASGGSYTTLPTVTFSAPPSGTTATATLTEGVLTLSFGTSATYTTMPTVTFTASPAGGSFTATASPTGTVLTATASGGSYTSLPTVTFAAPTSGTRATATVTMSVATVNTPTTGTDRACYTISAGAPTVTFSASPAGAPDTATGTAVLGASTHGGCGTGQSTVASVTVGNGGGSGYTALPTMTFSGGTCSSGTCPATDTVATMTLSGIANLSGGSGYTSFPGMTFSPTGATGTVTSMTINGINLTKAGSGYTAIPTITFSSGTASATVTAMTVTGIANLSGGSGYTTTPTLTFSPTGASGTVTMTVSAITNISGGSGYTSFPGMTFSPTGATGTVSSMTINGINLTKAGSGYASTPAITFSSGGASAAVSAMTVTGITVSTAGSGYTSLPGITFDTTYGSGASASVTSLKIASFSVGTEGSYLGTSYPTATTTGGTNLTVVTTLLGANVTVPGSFTAFPTVLAGGVAFTVTTDIVSINITSAGTSYTSGPVTVGFSTGNAAATADLKIVSLGVPTPGAYTSFPTASITGNAQLGAVTAEVVSVQVSSPGSGYTARPTVTIGSPTSGTTATATATLNVTAVNLTYGGGGYSAGTSVVFGSGSATGTANVNPGNILTPGSAPTAVQVSSSATVQASPITEIYTDGDQDLLFFGFGSSAITSEVASWNVNTSSAGAGSPYTITGASDTAQGTSAIDVDNVASAAGASSIYFAELGGIGGVQTFNFNQVCQNSSTNPPNCNGSGTTSFNVSFVGPTGEALPTDFVVGATVTISGAPSGPAAYYNGRSWVISAVGTNLLGLYPYFVITSDLAEFVDEVGVSPEGTANAGNPPTYNAVKLTQTGLQ